MKAILTTFLLVTFLATNNFISQDIIITKKGDEIESKVLEINQKEVTYKKFSNLEGPNYIISRSDIFMIKYKNGEKELFNEKEIEADKAKKEKSKSNIAKHHINLNITPGGDPKTFGQSNNGGIIYGLTYVHFFNENWGLKTGVSGLYILGELDVEDTRIGFPIKALYKSSQKLGFYSELGFSYYIPTVENWGASNASYYDQLSGSLEHSGLAFETLMGLNYKLNDKFNAYSGLSIHILPYSYQKYSFSKNEWETIKESRLGFVGLELGIRYNLQKTKKND